MGWGAGQSAKSHQHFLVFCSDDALDSQKQTFREEDGGSSCFLVFR